MARRAGWALFVLTCALCAAQAILIIASDVPFWSVDVLVDLGFPLVSIGAILGAAIGALIIARDPRNAIGWLFAVGQLGSALGILSDAAIHYVTTTGEPGGIPSRFVALGQLFNLIYVLTFLSLVFLLVPDGRVLNRRWRFTPAIPIAALVLQWAAILTISPSQFAAGQDAEFGWVTTTLVLASNVLIGVAVVLGAISIFKRLRVARGEARQQLRWLAAGAVVVAALFVLTFTGALVLARGSTLIYLVLYLAYIFVFVAVGIAILRYRLYDIDVILSRAIVLAVLAVFVTVGYIAVVVAIGSVLTVVGSADSPESALFWPSLVATALIATAFQPLRTHVLRLADRLVYGRRAVPYEALADLSRELADRPTRESLPARVAEATGRAVGAASAVAIVGAPGESMTRGTWQRDKRTRPAGDAVTVPVRDLGEEVGCVMVTMPPGRHLRDFERALLDDVGGQAGVAFRSALLEVELAARVQEIERRSTDLADSRRRLVRAEDEARERLAEDIARRVVPGLARVADDLEAATPREALAAMLERHIALVEAALEELRAVCRGVFPALLERRGLVPALAAELDKRPAATLEIGDYPQDRLDRATEAAAYQFAVEVAPSTEPSDVRISVASDELVAEVTASGGAFPAGADAWQHARDRVAALDGSTTVRANASGRTTVRAVIPLAPQVGRVDAVLAHTASSPSGPKSDLGT